jgi:sodium/proline symporter
VPVILAGIFLSAILAAIMSTADSQLLVTSSSIVEDVFKALSKKTYSEKSIVWMSRFAVVLVAIIASLIGLNPDSKVLSLVSYAWGGFGATFGPVILVSLYSKRATKQGAIAGILTGGITVIIWKNLSGGIFELYEIVPGFLFSMVAILLFLKRD